MNAPSNPILERNPVAADRPRKVVVVGLGKTGLSCARWLHRRGHAVAVVDSRERPPGLAQARDELPDVALILGGFDATVLGAADEIVLSPGVARSEPLIAAAIAAGVPVIGDVELFARALAAAADGVEPAPVIAITGSNGKSTVTTLLGLMARQAGVAVAVGGNLGEPVLDLLAATPDATGDATGPALYVIELSSFQLESTSSLRPRAATVLNLSPDHLDRYPDFATYAAAKARVFAGAGAAVVNRDDPPAAALAAGVAEQLGFTLGAPQQARDYGILIHQHERWIARGDQPLLPVSEVLLPGNHNLANVLAALALAETCGLPLTATRATLRSFRGLPHRSALVGVDRRVGGDVRFIDDSKGTNPGATIAALTGLVPSPDQDPARAVLIAGGDGKGADFASLAPAVQACARAVVLLGRDAPRLAAALVQAGAGSVPQVQARDMIDAVRQAAALAAPGDCVLLSPACASFDMFDNYQHRGRVFAEAVARLLA